MKTPKILLLSVLSAISLSAQAAVEVRFEDDGPGVEPIKGQAIAGLISAASATPAINERVIISSLCASSSPNVVASRRNAIGGMFEVAVNKDPDDPAGWHLVPTSAPEGWQWHDVITASSFSMWRGDLNTSMTSERGNRLVAHFIGRSPVSAYKGRVITTLTNIAETTFVIGQNSSGARRFNLNFVGIKLGANGVLDSSPDPTTGIWIQRSDDTVYTGGQNPSETDYDIWIDFGATIVVTANSSSSLDGVRNQFINGTPELKVELIRNDEIVAESLIKAERPRLEIYRGDFVGDETKNVRIYLSHGQWNVPYEIQWTEDLNLSWLDLGMVLKKLSDGLEIDINSELNPFPEGFFRAYSGSAEVISSASARLRPKVVSSSK